MEVRRGNPDRPLVALTFDAGADAGYTTRILETLRSEKIKASFSITGQWAQQYPDLVKAIAGDGHLLMNHSQDHPSFTGLSNGTRPLTREERISQLQQAEEEIKALTGVSTKPFFRPPYGDVDGSVLCDAYAAGYGYVVMWSVDTQGWNHATSEQILQTALAGARPGAIYLMHVGSQSADAVALPQIIQGLRAKGYQFGTVADLLP
jgi:peptidoglycan/xylan/chitin deacetylase (PgdA/CDA1 family)